APGSQFDRLNVPGTVSLNGTLDITLINGFVPTLGDSFSVVTTGNRVGTFNVVNGRAIPGGLFFNVKYRADRVDLIAGIPPPDNAPTANDDATTTGEDQGV